jgi:membrane fusion protein, adhesin transport system
MKSLKKLLQLVSPEFANMRNIYLLAGLQGIFYLAVPLGVQSIITYTMAGQFSASLLLLAILTVTGVLFLGLFQLWQMRIDETIQQSLLVNVSIRFSEKLSSLKPELYLSNYLPSKINHFFEVLTLQKGLSKILLDASFSVISIVFGLIILAGYSSLFLIFTLIIAVAFYFIVRIYGNRALEANLLESKKKFRFVEWLHNLYIGLRQNDSSLTQDYIINKTDQSLSEYISEKNEFYRLIDLQYRGILIFKVIFTALLLLVGVWLVQAGFLNIGQFVAAEILVILIINSVEKLVMSLTTVYNVLTAAEKLFQVFDLESDEEKLTPEYVAKNIELENKVLSKIYQHSYQKKTRHLVYYILLIGIGIMFLPWTQTIDSTGKVTTINPEDRPQTIPSRIAGRIEKWYVNEGDLVKKNDTIAFISEVKEDYFDPQLIGRTQSQLKAKESSIISYEQKINSIDVQIDAINASFILKTQQAKNKVIQSKAKLASDSADFVAVSNNYKISEEQFSRFEDLLAKGIISKTDYENRKAKLQEFLSKKVASENKWNNAKADLLNAYIELNSIRQDYNEKLMKSESDKFSALSMLYDAEAGLTKMQNQLSNYTIRNSYYYVTAPQDGFITKSYVQGVGEIVKEGSPLISIVPNNVGLSVEFFIDPIDVPLIHKGANVQLTFDGWPAFVFSGWPGVSFGTYHAKVVAIDKVISDNGKFRVLAVKSSQEWPEIIQVGGGVKALVMLQDVPVIYELWRKANGFPPEFYQEFSPKKQSEKKSKDEEK